jgi:signal transduction histidine kinase
MTSLEINFDIVIVFFVYGLAFFCMGLVLMLEARRYPRLAEARVLWPLAIFGFVHGAHEWLEMAILIAQWFDLEIPATAPWVRLGMLVISFASLILFSLQALRPGEGPLSPRAMYVGGGLLVLYVSFVVITSLSSRQVSTHWMEHADALSRYLLAVPGAALAAFALYRQSRWARSQDRQGLAFNFLLAALGFAGYSLTQILVAPGDVFLAPYINSAIFLELTGMPIQVVRAVCAVVIIFGLVRAIQVVDDERQVELIAAQEARLQALEQIQQDLIEREAMRRELLRHTVIAQEDERGRIARELHDETAQFLTALSLNLATLKNNFPGDQKSEQLLERLQTLSQQMSQGIQRMVRDLRPAQLDDLGLISALQVLIDEARNRTSLEVALQIEGNHRRIDRLIETVLFRVVQEALTNVIRHAQCNQATVELAYAEEQVSVRIGDEGAGFDLKEVHLPPRGWGLEGMRERAESVGGELVLHSAPGKGTLVEVQIPLTNVEPVELEEVHYEQD